MSIENFLESLKWRYATKTFDKTKKVPDELLSKLLNALSLSPSSFGLQPWKFFVITDPALRETLKGFAWNQPQITECSHLIVLASKNSIDANYINAYADQIAKERNLPLTALDGYRGMMLDFLPMIQGDNGQTWMTKQLYIALGILMSACAEARVDCCPMEGFNPSKFDEVLNLPAKGFNARVLCPIGYRSQSDQNASLKKIRFAQSEIAEFI